MPHCQRFLTLAEPLLQKAGRLRSGRRRGWWTAFLYVRTCLVFAVLAGVGAVVIVCSVASFTTRGLVAQSLAVQDLSFRSPAIHHVQNYGRSAAALLCATFHGKGLEQAPWHPHIFHGSKIDVSPSSLQDAWRTDTSSLQDAETHWTKLKVEAMDNHLLSSVTAFLDGAGKVGEQYRRGEEAAVQAALDDNSKLLKRSVDEFMAAAKEAARALNPKIERADTLPAKVLHWWNSRLKGGLLEADCIDEPLLAAAQKDSGLYPHLANKVKTMCNRSREELEQRAVTVLRASLLEGGKHRKLDSRREELKAAMTREMEQLFREHAVPLAQSDHQPVLGRLIYPPGSEIARSENDVSEPGPKPMAIFSWNVMEFPDILAEQQVLDGVNVYCEHLQTAVNRSGAEGRKALQMAMSSEVVINEHASAVLRKVKAVLDSPEADVVLLQEVNGGVRARLEEYGRSKGWYAYFSQTNSDPIKCQAGTAVISREPFDEGTDVEVQEHGKTRYFAAVRWGRTWAVSIHVPIAQQKNGIDFSRVSLDTSMRVLRLLAERFLVEHKGELLVTGGDWNANVIVVAGHAAAEPPEGCQEVALTAPPSNVGSTCFGVSNHPIDGILSLYAPSPDPAD